MRVGWRDTQPINTRKEEPVAFGTPMEMPVVVNEPARLMTVMKTEAGLPDITRFDVRAVNDAISRHMEVLKPEETVACIAHVDLKGGNVAIVGRVPDSVPGNWGWTVYTSKEWRGDWNAGAALRWSL